MPEYHTKIEIDCRFEGPKRDTIEGHEAVIAKADQVADQVRKLILDVQKGLEAEGDDFSLTFAGRSKIEEM